MFDRTYPKTGKHSGLLCNKLYKIYRSVFKDVTKDWRNGKSNDEHCRQEIDFFFFNIVDRRYIIILWLILLRFVSFYFVYF